MRVLVAPALLLALAALSGCVSLVEDDPQLQEAAAEAQAAYSSYEAQAGHISGAVRDADGKPLVGALVDLVGVSTGLATDGKGRFAFLDLTPGVYTVAASMPGYLASSTSVEVVAGQFARPDFVLTPEAPAPYYTVFHFEAFQQAGVLGIPLDCYCDFEGDLDAEGLTQAVLEATVTEATTVFAGPGFAWSLQSWDETQENVAYVGADSPSPLYEVIEADAFAPAAIHWVLDIRPSGDVVTLDQAFDGYLTLFYNAPAPEGYSAYEAEA